LSFLTVSGVTATRVSPAMVSAGTPMSMDHLLVTGMGLMPNLIEVKFSDL